MPATALTLAPEAAFLLRVFREGLATQNLTPADLERYSLKAPNALVQLADYFGSSYLRPCLEAAAVQLTHAASLGLAHRTGNDVNQAWALVKTEPIARHSKHGFDLLRSLAHKAGVAPADLKAWLAQKTSQPILLAAYEDECASWDAADTLLSRLR